MVIMVKIAIKREQKRARSHFAERKQFRTKFKIGFDMKINNSLECFVRLWLLLERTRRLLQRQCKHFCIRRVLKEWFGIEATDDFIWEICSHVVVDDQQVCGYDGLPSPKLYPRKHRELLRAIVAQKLGISMCKVSLRALDAAYSIAFPNSTPINVNKKKRINNNYERSRNQ